VVHVTLKLFELCAVPLGVTTVIGPVAAPVGTVAVVVVYEFTVTPAAAVPLNETLIAMDRSGFIAGPPFFALSLRARGAAG